MALGTDPHSYANFEEAIVTRLDLDLSLDFSKKIISGHVDLIVSDLAGCGFVCLDAKALEIQEIVDTSSGNMLDFDVAFGSKLGEKVTIKLPSKTCKIRICYATTAACNAVQWLDAQQTKGKEHPLVFSQCQAICGRSLFPCQDTPAVKMPFGMKVTAPMPLVAIASGKKISAVENKTKGVTTFTYEQTIPVMSYLVAFICGNLKSCKVGPRSSIWIEPEAADAAQKEFDGIPEVFILEAEKVVGSAYCWGHFDVAILPPSFAYGGMENPNVTFFSSSLLAGDQSLLTTLAHEITHSWSGNLVTNSRWKDFWLNEGFTRYIERRILGGVHGKAFRGLVLTVGYNDLVKTVDMLCVIGDSKLTALEPDIVGIDPDEAFNRVPYEKGSLFLHYLEQLVGGDEAMSEWLKAYVADFNQKSIETKDFKDHFIQFFTLKGVNLSDIDWDHWLHGEGLPKYDLSKFVDQSLLNECRRLADTWLSGGRALMHKAAPDGVAAGDFDGKKAQEVMLFLDHLINAGGGAVPNDRLDAMNDLYHLSDTNNVEIGFRWALLNLKNSNKGSFAFVQKFLSSTGRGTYVKPVYVALDSLDHEFAVEVFRKNEYFYQSIISQYLRKLLKIGKRIEMRVTSKKSVSFYMSALRKLLQELEDVEIEIKITALGDAASVAVGVATVAERDGVCRVGKVATDLQQVASSRRSSAYIAIIVVKKA